VLNVFHVHVGLGYGFWCSRVVGVVQERVPRVRRPGGAFGVEGLNSENLQLASKKPARAYEFPTKSIGLNVSTSAWVMDLGVGVRVVGVVQERVPGVCWPGLGSLIQG